MLKRKYLAAAVSLALLGTACSDNSKEAVTPIETATTQVETAAPAVQNQAS